MWYFSDICQPVTVQGDPSKKGLRCCNLLQDGCPVAFTASKVLTPVEQHYANIDYVNCLPVSLEQNDSTPMSLDVPLHYSE